MSAPHIGFTLEGVPELESMFRELTDEVGTDALVQGALDGGRIVALTAQGLAPRATGRLASSIHEELTDSGAGYAEVTIGPDRDAWYGLYPEGGTRPHELDSAKRHTSGFHPGIQARRFMQTAADESEADVLNVMATRIREAVEDARAR